ncbi:HEAT repeat domain-containing protein [Anaerotignum lactatifermentans]|uniref:HEAT repeat domain-containing protein n=1 Tax=Anaerotignum lactatifermentans TaxID=160404 RepID=A0ABS2GDF8_9FIRM|nr:HEAT repeat domain-containing protein [Anaerotignum lactatifermentans]MBM6830187.1 HEAT repeat domain-containing protein [Anaerotignum lactatifermentans]MBM6878740.1 HEAT repeat domain-containing protein [Anaerotignum lactatifermentans]MBM6951804.1 HEAT repeat domain-containing protein [Anaerotignum lactatifermentans]
MKVEIIIYIYGAICISMIGFNIVYNLMLRRRDALFDKRTEKMRQGIRRQFQLIQKGEKTEKNHKKFLMKKLKRINYLIAYDNALQMEMKDQKAEVLEKYFSQIESVILFLAVRYSKKDKMEAGYFAFFLSEYAVNRKREMDSLLGLLLIYVKKDNLYCRVNGLKALYHLGDVENVITALKMQDDDRIYINQKILTEGLLTFQGNHDDLIHGLWKEFNRFTDHTKLAILNYIRFKTGDYKEEIYGIMTDEKADKELRLSAIRYFGKYVYPPALKWLLDFVNDHEPSHWEYVNVAVSSLSRYEGEEVIRALKGAIKSPNWYIRYSAAQGLEAHRLNYSELFDIINGEDRYAREMMTYRLEAKMLQETGGDNS